MDFRLVRELKSFYWEDVGFSMGRVPRVSRGSRPGNPFIYPSLKEIARMVLLHRGHPGLAGGESWGTLSLMPTLPGRGRWARRRPIASWPANGDDQHKQTRDDSERSEHITTPVIFVLKLAGQ